MSMYGFSLCSSPERNSRSEGRKRLSSSEGVNASNFLVETVDLPPGVERTIVIWYTPTTVANAELSYGDNLDGADLKGCRLLKQTFRVSFRCFLLQGPWQQAQSRVYDRTLGKSIHIRARTCTSIVTVTPSVLHLGDCNIGELKSSSCMLTNHSELPTVVKPIVTSKVISTVPNDDMMLGPKQSTELKIEIIPRKTNPNYSRLISVINMKNKSNIPQICVRSSNMDAHHVIYHSLFYKLLTQSRSAFLNFEHVTINSVGIQVFDLENITNAPLHLNLQSSDGMRVRLYYIKPPFPGSAARISTARNREEGSGDRQQQLGQISGATNIAVGRLSGVGNNLVASSGISQTVIRPIRRRRSFGSVAELTEKNPGFKRSTALALQRHLSKRLSTASTITGANISQPGGTLTASLVSPSYDGPRMRFDQLPSMGSEGWLDESHTRLIEGVTVATTGYPTHRTSIENESKNEELDELLSLFDKSRAEVEQYCHSVIPSPDKEQDIVGMIRDRNKRLQALITQKTLVPLSSNKERNIRLPAKSRQRIVAVFAPASNEAAHNNEGTKTRIEKHKVLITLPPGGNKKAINEASKFESNKPIWATSKHPFDTRPSVRELLLKGRVCRSVLNVNQKNINFGRIAASSKSSKRLVVQNMAAVPLVYSVEKTGSISSGFLQIKEGEVGVVKAFGTKEICFEFLPTLAGPFEERLKIVNVQDASNSVSVIIKAKVVKRETFKLLQAGKTLALGKCLVGERSDEIKISIRNMSRKKREYVIQLDPAFSEATLRPNFFFSIDDTPATTITQAQEKKLDEELEKLEHKLRIAVTKKKTEKIEKLNAKISRVKALLNGEQVLDGSLTDTESDAGGPGAGSESGEAEYYDSNSESEFSDSESTPRRIKTRKKGALDVRSNSPSHLTMASPSSNNLTFSVDAEATCRIIAYAIFKPAPIDNDSMGKASGSRGHKSKKRQQRRDSTPLIGVGKFLLYEQQNKDVLKDLQYSAEVYSRTPAGESAFCQAVGRNLPPPSPISHGVPRFPRSQANNGLLELAREAKQSRAPNLTAINTVAEPADSTFASDEKMQLDPSSPLHAFEQKLLVAVEPDEYFVSSSFGLLIPIEESPTGFRGWTVRLSLPEKFHVPQTVEVKWSPTSALRHMLGVSCFIKASKGCVAGETVSSPGGMNVQGSITLIRAVVEAHQTLELNLKWCFAESAGFAPTTALSSVLNRAMIDAVSRASEIPAGTIDFFSVPPTAANAEQELLSVVSVSLVKSTQRALWLDKDSIDLGESMQNVDTEGEFVIRNTSHQAAQFLLIASSSRDVGASAASIGTSTLCGGEITFKNSTGTVEAGSDTTVSFYFKGFIPGQHVEQVMVRNLNDRTETSTLTINARVVRPVYVRIPELDPQSTGKLEVLNLGACYVTPEMQDTTVDSPNLSLKFSKVHKLTLHSQVDEQLIVCASSNLKTQCYVYEDARLHREAANVVLKGRSTVDLFVAFRPRLSADSFRTGSTRDLVGGIRMQLFSMGPEVVLAQNMEERKEMVAEFTVKFVGVAGVSLARVFPSSIDFGVEHNTGMQQACKMHEGHFELINASKALPLAYRLFVVDVTDDYSDDDESLHVSLKHEKGEISPGETGIIEFRAMAYTNGLFRRRILVENIHYPGKVSFVEIVLFVDSGELECQVLSPTLSPNLLEAQPTAFAQELTTIDVGAVNVIKLEDELSDVASMSESEMEMINRKYRIYRESTFEGYESGNMWLRLTNTSKKVVAIRPFSTLPLVFRWTNEASKEYLPPGHEWYELVARSTSIEEARKLQATDLAERDAASRIVFFGSAHELEPNSSCCLSFQFAKIATTMALPSDIIEAGKLCSFLGMIGLQGFELGNSCDETAESTSNGCTLKTLRVVGSYGEPSLVVAERHISLGKIGYSVGWKSSGFSVTVRNVSDLNCMFTIANLPDYVRVLQVHGADEASVQWQRDHIEQTQIPSLRSLALQADRSLVSFSDTPGRKAWKLPARTACIVELELAQSAQVRNYPLNWSAKAILIISLFYAGAGCGIAQLLATISQLVQSTQHRGCLCSRTDCVKLCGACC